VPRRKLSDRLSAIHFWLARPFRRVFGGGIAFFCAGDKLPLPVVVFVGVAGWWVHPPLSMPGLLGPTCGPMPVEVFPVPALPCACAAISGKAKNKTAATMQYLAI
jgi:hypothetical protein